MPTVFGARSNTKKEIDEIARNDWCEALAYGGQYIKNYGLYVRDSASITGTQCGLANS